MVKKFTVIIEQDEDGKYVGSVPELKGCHTQGDSLDDLMQNAKEAIQLCLEVAEMKNKKKQDEDIINKFVGVQQIEVA